MTVFTDFQQRFFESLQNRLQLLAEGVRAYFAYPEAAAAVDVSSWTLDKAAIKTGQGLGPSSSLDWAEERERRCPVCEGPMKERTVFVIQLQNGEHRSVCCPHCGLLALDQPAVRVALATDFIYGRIINAHQAIYLIGSAVKICCSPSALCFENKEEAQRFQAGFGGRLCGLEEARAEIKGLQVS
jgi:hypothetical protein